MKYLDYGSLFMTEGRFYLYAIANLIIFNAMIYEGYWQYVQFNVCFLIAVYLAKRWLAKVYRKESTRSVGIVDRRLMLLYVFLGGLGLNSLNALLKLFLVNSLSDWVLLFYIPISHICF